MTFPRQQIEAIARAVEAAGGNVDDVCDLCWVWGDASTRTVNGVPPRSGPRRD